MGKTNYLKLGSALAFLALAAVSCWATQESLHLLLPSWPQALCWVVTVAFFFIASWGTKLIVDSFNANAYVEKRGLRLLAGIGIMLVFWLIFSMPTNTHTFFYRNAISGVASSDITATKGYLDQLKNNTVTEKKIQEKQTEVENAVWSKFGELKAEILNDANPGFGPNAKRILADFADLLLVKEIKPLSFTGTSEQQRQKLVTAYRAKIQTLLDTRLANIRTSILTPDEDTYKRQAAADWTNLDLYEGALKDGNADLEDADDVKELDNRLTKAYSTIRNYQQYVIFQPGDEEQYIPEDGHQQVTKVKKMLSVFDVWKDFLAGNYKGQGLIIWVLLSILVDLGAFIFFDMAFKKDEYSI